MEHQSLEETFERAAELDFEDLHPTQERVFPREEDFDTGNDSDDSVDLGLQNDVKESEVAMSCVVQLGDVVRDLLSWKDRLLVLYPLPTEVQLHLVLPLSKLTRLKNMLLPSVRHLQRLAQIFASGQVGDEMIKHMRAVLTSCQAELAVEKQRRIEAERKLRVLVMQNDNQHRMVQIIKWMKLFAMLRRRELIRAGKHKVAHLHHVIGNLRRQSNKAMEDTKHLKEELQMTKVEAHAMIKQAHQSALKYVPRDEEGIGAGDANDEVDRLIGTRLGVGNRPKSRVSSMDTAESRPVSALSNLSGNYSDELIPVETTSAITRRKTKFRLPKTQHAPTNTALADVEDSSVKDLTQSCSTVPENLERRGLSKRLSSSVQHVEKLYGEGGIATVSPEEALAIFKKSKEAEKEPALDPLPTEKEWQKRYFLQVSDHSEEGDTSTTNTNHDPDSVPICSPSIPLAKFETEGMDYKHQEICQKDSFMPISSSSRDDALQARVESIEDYRNRVHRLEAIIQGLETELRLTARPGRHLVQRKSPSTIRQQATRSEDTCVGEAFKKADVEFQGRESPGLRPWTSGSWHNVKLAKAGEVRPGEKANLPAKFLPTKMPPNQPYKQARFKAKPLHPTGLGAKIVDFSSRIMGITENAPHLKTRNAHANRARRFRAKAPLSERPTYKNNPFNFY